jgi:hypothetical protein
MFSGSIRKDNITAEQNSKGNNSIRIVPDKTEYNKRDKIQLTLKFSENGSKVLANLSISVSEEVPGIHDTLSIDNYLSMGSNKSVSRKFPDSGNYMFLPERKGEIIEGKVIDQLSQRTLSKACIFLSAVDSLVNLQYNFSDTNGLFRFLLNDYYYGKDLVFSIKDSPPNKKVKIQLVDKFELNNIYKPLRGRENQFVKDYILKSQDIVTIQKIYQETGVTEIKKQFKVFSICPRIYFKPNYKVNPDDFMPLNDFAEISREIIPPQLKIGKHNGIYHASMADESQHMFLNEEPAIFLDGVFLDNINQVMQLGTDRVKKVELVCSRYNYGELIFPGILAVFSKNNEIKNIQPSSTALRTQLETFHPYSVFNSPSATIKNSAHHPDFRQLLYWNPEIEISNNKNQIPEFYASDHSGNYIIRIEGISSEGFPISAIARIKVK